MSVENFLLSAEDLPDYLRSRGLAARDDRLDVRALGGGVSNLVLLVEWPGNPGRRWVVKQSLGKLRVKDDWRSDRGRIFREADSIRALRPFLGERALPEVVHIDAENFLFVMTAAPAGSLVWKDSLLEGVVDLGIANQAGRLLARMINASRSDARFREDFADQTVFDQLRVDPYYRTTAARHPEARRELEELIADSREIRTALVHGDYSPKNMLVKGGNIFLIDFEVIHWGDPAFDSAFLLNHLFLKALYQPRFAARYFEATREFVRAAHQELDREDWPKFEAMTCRHLGGLMLARIDGKSPVEYIRDEATRQRVRAVSLRILRARPNCVEEIVGIVSAVNDVAD